MKTKLSKEKKQHRQEWRDKQHARPSANAPHHLSNSERQAIARVHAPLPSLSEFVAELLHMEPKPVKPAKKPYLKMRARKKHATQI